MVQNIPGTMLKNNEAGNSLNAVKCKPVPTRTLNTILTRNNVATERFLPKCFCTVTWLSGINKGVFIFQEYIRNRHGRIIQGNKVYRHIGKKTDPNAGSVIFVLNGALAYK